jgi:hypothetical protein
MDRLQKMQLTPYGPRLETDRQAVCEPSPELHEPGAARVNLVYLPFVPAAWIMGEKVERYRFSRYTRRQGIHQNKR